eukprot:CAMPEP_0167827168 /NCGR_PEP_ID=MMETSP0112_2-20121227/10533_1 /TAXON_ID=91324 /ORGANISM="Lotharella globosa, Strain CCCM811" /LENGTH=81 /DNA_ID=CAMNT_0007729879 /DNA_START=351 /DNA_END=592 /DNA_ORIENTATION=-
MVRSTGTAEWRLAEKIGVAALVRTLEQARGWLTAVAVEAMGFERRSCLVATEMTKLISTTAQMQNASSGSRETSPLFLDCG